MDAQFLSGGAPFDVALRLLKTLHGRFEVSAISLLGLALCNRRDEHALCELMGDDAQR
jgi:hypothetical protein